MLPRPAATAQHHSLPLLLPPLPLPLVVMLLQPPLASALYQPPPQLLLVTWALSSRCAGRLRWWPPHPPGAVCCRDLPPRQYLGFQSRAALWRCPALRCQPAASSLAF